MTLRILLICARYPNGKGSKDEHEWNEHERTVVYYSGCQTTIQRFESARRLHLIFKALPCIGGKKCELL